MENVYIDQKHIETGTEHSSKGNQLKWKIEDKWYKADAFGYESLSEAVVSDLLGKTNVKAYVKYEPVRINYFENEYQGCRSTNFLKEDQELVPLERLHRLYTGFGLAKELARFPDTKTRISYTADMVSNVTGLEQFGEYLTIMMEMDAFFLNEDRHTNNIAVIYHKKDKEYELCPYFDMGLALFSDIKEDFPLNKSLEECRKSIMAKPFSRDFDEQLDAANELYGCHLKFGLHREDIANIVGNYRGIYQDEVIDRVTDILRMQMRKYAYMFVE